MSRFQTFALGAFVLYVAVYLLPLGARPLVAPDETRYAEVPREMVESGDWIVPTLDGLVYFEKPPLGYWATAASLVAFGENRFAVRIAYSLATGLAALVVYFMVRRSGGGRWPGLLAAAAFLTCAQVYGVGTFAVLDGLLAMLVIAAMGTFWFGYVEPNRLKRHAWYAAFGACCGLAFLTKGFLAFIFPVVALVPFMFWERRWKELFIIPWIPMAAAAVVSLPWSIAIAVRGAGFWEYFFWEAHFHRFTMGKYATYPEPWWYYLPFVLGGALPWILFVPAAARACWKGRPWDSFVRYNACWFVFPLVFLSLSKGKLGPYVQPVFAPLVIWLVVWMTRSVTRSRRNLDFAAVVIAACMTLGSVGVLIQTLTDALNLGRTYMATEAWKGYAGTVALLLGAALTFAAWRARRTRHKYAFFTAATAVLLLVVPFVTPSRLDDKTPEIWLEMHAEYVDPDAILVTDGHFVHAVCWAYKRDDVYLLPNVGEMAYALRRPDGEHRALTSETFMDLVLDPDRTRTIVLFGLDCRFEEILDQLPEPRYFKMSRGALIAVF